MRKIKSKSIGQVIKEIRTMKKIRQNELAKRANMSKNYLSEIENENNMPSIRILRKIAHGLGVSVIEILEESNFEETGENKSIYE